MSAAGASAGSAANAVWDFSTEVLEEATSSPTPEREQSNQKPKSGHAKEQKTKYEEGYEAIEFAGDE